MKTASSICGAPLLFVVVLLCSCSGFLDPLTPAGRYPSHAVANISSSSATYQVFDYSEDNQKVIPLDAYLEVDLTEKAKCDIHLHYDFDSSYESFMGMKFPNVGRTLNSYCDIVLKDVPFQRKKGKMCFDISGLTGDFDMEIVDKEIYNDVTVSGLLNMSDKELFSDLSISGMVRNWPFSIKVEELSKDKPEYTLPTLCVSTSEVADMFIRNSTSQTITLRLTSPLYNNKTKTAITYMINPSETFEGSLRTATLEDYSELTILTNGRKSFINPMPWKDYYHRDDYYVSCHPLGKIEPIIYPIVDIEIIEDGNGFRAISPDLFE